MDFNSEEIYQTVRYNLQHALDTMNMTGVPSKNRIAGCTEALECIQRAEHFYTYLLQEAMEEEE